MTSSSDSGPGSLREAIAGAATGETITFAVTGMMISGYVYKSAANHDPDGSSNGSTIFVRRP